MQRMQLYTCNMKTDVLTTEPHRQRIIQ